MKYHFSTAIVVTRTRLSVTLYVHCLSCAISKSLIIVSWNARIALMSKGIRQTIFGVFRVLLCTRLLYCSQIRSFKYNADILSRLTSIGLRSLCTVPIIFHVGWFPDCAKLTRTHCHTNFHVFFYHFFSIYWRLEGLYVKNWAYGYQRVKRAG